MRIKTILIILITVLLTVVLMQNTDPDHFNFLWARFPMPKLVMLAVVGLIAFILGYLVGRPKRIKRLGGGSGDFESGNNQHNTLSDEDKDYIH